MTCRSWHRSIRREATRHVAAGDCDVVLWRMCEQRCSKRVSHPSCCALLLAQFVRGVILTSPNQFSPRQILNAKVPEPGGGSIWSAEGNRASNRLTRRLATYHGNWIWRARLAVDDLLNLSGHQIEFSASHRPAARAWTRSGRLVTTDRSKLWIVHGLIADSAGARKIRSNGLDTDTVAERSRTWILRGLGQTAVVIAD